MEREKGIIRLALCLAALLTLGTGLAGFSAEPAQAATKTDAVQSTTAIGANQCHIRYARGFTVTYHDGYKMVTVFEPGRSHAAKKMNTFILVPRGTRPQIPAEGKVIEVPVRRVVVRSASHVPFFSMLGIADRIVGIVQGRYVNDPEVAERIRRGQIREVGVGSGMTAQFNMERLLTLHPDLILSWWTNNPAYAAHIKAEEAGLPVALASDYEENTPLGRTEWIKFVAPFFNAEAEAERVFSDIEDRYLTMRKKAKAVIHRPTVMYGNAYQGVWYIAGGQSYFAALAKDAGGRYAWEDDPATGSKPVNMETAMMRGRNADYWISQNENYFSLASIAAEDARLRLFRSFQAGHIYSTNGRIGPGGGNDYYQSSVAHPDLVLADMIAILHPELIPDHKLIWHVHLPATLSNNRVTTRGRKNE